MKKCVGAHTATDGAIYPEYVNIYEAGDGIFEITVREKQTDGGSMGQVVSMRIGHEDLKRFLTDALNSLAV